MRLKESSTQCDGCHIEFSIDLSTTKTAKTGQTVQAKPSHAGKLASQLAAKRSCPSQPTKLESKRSKPARARQPTQANQGKPSEAKRAN